MSPSFSLAESPKGGRMLVLAPFTVITARSSGWYLPISVADSVEAELASNTWKLVAFPATWPLVTIVGGGVEHHARRSPPVSPARQRLRSRERTAPPCPPQFRNGRSPPGQALAASRQPHHRPAPTQRTAAVRAG